MAKGTCSIEGCEKKAHSRGWCSMHYQRWRSTGSTERTCETCHAPILGFGAARYCGDNCRPRCSVEGCESPVRGKGWCAAHCVQARKLGAEAVPFKHKWGKLGAPCSTCGGPVPDGIGMRKHCSESCKSIESHHAAKGATRPAALTCNLCGREFRLGQRKAGSRMQRSDTIWCRSCSRTSPEVNRFKRYGVTLEQYAAAMLEGCGICGDITKLHIDHDHSCCPASRYSKCGNCNRGFLCGNCNRAIGLFRDEPKSLLKAIEYLEAASNR